MQNQVAVVNDREAARFLGLSRQTLANWRATRNQKSPRYVKIGSRILYKISDLEDYINQHVVDPRATSEESLHG